MPFVSVIIPNYNHATFLRERIDSVLNQTYQHIEVIILDDCSTDNSREIIESYRGHEKIKHIIYNTINSGSTFKQWEKGMKLATGEWIWIAESDDVAEILLLEKLLSIQIKNEARIRYCSSLLIDENGIIISENTLQPNKLLFDNSILGVEFIRNFLIKENSIPNASAVIFKKDLINSKVFKQIEGFKLNGDWMFWILLLKNSNIYFNSTPLNKFRIHSHNVRTKEISIALLEYLYIADFLDSLGYGAEVSDRLRYIYKSQIINKREKWNIYKYFIKKVDFKQLFFLIFNR